MGNFSTFLTTYFLFWSLPEKLLKQVWSDCMLLKTFAVVEEYTVECRMLHYFKMNVDILSQTRWNFNLLLIELDWQTDKKHTQSDRLTEKCFYRTDRQKNCHQMSHHKQFSFINSKFVRKSSFHGEFQSTNIFAAFPTLNSQIASLSFLFGFFFSNKMAEEFSSTSKRIKDFIKVVMSIKEHVSLWSIPVWIFKVFERNFFYLKQWLGSKKTRQLKCKWISSLQLISQKQKKTEEEREIITARRNYFTDEKLSWIPKRLPLFIFARGKWEGRKCTMHLN